MKFIYTSKDYRVGPDQTTGLVLDILHPVMVIFSQLLNGERVGFYLASQHNRTLLFSKGHGMQLSNNDHLMKSAMWWTYGKEVNVQTIPYNVLHSTKSERMELARKWMVAVENVTHRSLFGEGRY